MHDDISLTQFVIPGLTRLPAGRQGIQCFSEIQLSCLPAGRRRNDRKGEPQKFHICSVSVFLQLADAIYELSWSHYSTTFKFFEREMPSISRDNKVGLSFYGTFQDPVIRFVRLKYF